MGLAEEQTAAALSQFTGQPIGADWESIQQALAGMEQQSAKWQEWMQGTYGSSISQMWTQGPPPVGAAPADDRLARLERLAKLRDSGALSAEEFEAEKATLLESG
jgi:hypothetical protein